MAVSQYTFTDLAFRNKVTAIILNGGAIRGHAIIGSRRIPCLIAKLRGGDGYYVESNDRRYAGGYPPSIPSEFQYSYYISFNDGSVYFEGEIADEISLQDNPKYLVIDIKTKKAGSFQTKEEIEEYLIKNPHVELRYFEVTDELKPEIKVLFD